MFTPNLATQKKLYCLSPTYHCRHFSTGKSDKDYVNSLIFLKGNCLKETAHSFLSQLRYYICHSDQVHDQFDETTKYVFCYCPNVQSTETSPANYMHHKIHNSLTYWQSVQRHNQVFCVDSSYWSGGREEAKTSVTCILHITVKAYLREGKVKQQDRQEFSCKGYERHNDRRDAGHFNKIKEEISWRHLNIYSEVVLKQPWVATWNYTSAIKKQ